MEKDTKSSALKHADIQFDQLLEAVRTAFDARYSYVLALRKMGSFPLQMVIDTIQVYCHRSIMGIKVNPQYKPFSNSLSYLNKDEFSEEIDLQNYAIERIENRRDEVLDQLKFEHPEYSLAGKLRLKKSVSYHIHFNHFNPSNQSINPIHLHSYLSNPFQSLLIPYHMSNNGQNENKGKCGQIDPDSPYIGYLQKSENDQPRKNEVRKIDPTHLITEVLVPWGMPKILKQFTSLNKEEREIAYIVIHLASNRNREFKHIHSDILTRLSSGKAYKHIIDTLKKGTDTGKIIEVSGYVVGEHSKGFRLTEKYHFWKQKLVKLSKPYNAWGVSDVSEKHSDLVDVLSWTQPYFIYPTIDEVKAKAKELSKAGEPMLSSYKGEKVMKKCVYATAQGMGLDEYDEEEYRLLDLDIYDFERMIKNGWRTPSISNCGRVYYDIAGMPKWIRKLVRIKLNPNDAEGEEIVEIDYQALHHNLIPEIFKKRIPKEEYDKYRRELGGDSHTKLANLINATIADPKKHLTRQDVKTIGLSFWNKTHAQQMKSLIYPFLRDGFKIMMKRVASTKFANPTRSKTKMKLNKKTGKREKVIVNMAHAETSDILFQSESTLMEMNLVALRDMGIAAGYAYDALWVPKSCEEKVRGVMNRTAKFFDVMTSA